MNALNIIASPDAKDESISGLIVFWSVTGGPCSHDTLTEDLQDTGAVGDDDLPELPSPAVAFHRALQQFEGPARFLRARKPRGAGFYIVDEAQGEQTLDLATNMLVTLKDGKVAAEGDDPEDLAPEIQVAYDIEARQMAGRDVSIWMVERVKALDAVPLRPSGGMYFVPRDRMDQWRTISKCVQASTGYQVFEISAMHTDEAVESILAAVLHESKSEADQILADIRGGRLGAKALRTRAARSEALALKVERYEKLLNREVETYRETFEELEGMSVRAALAAEAEAALVKGGK